MCNVLIINMHDYWRNSATHKHKATKSNEFPSADQVANRKKRNSLEAWSNNHSSSTRCTIIGQIISEMLRKLEEDNVDIDEWKLLVINEYCNFCIDWIFYLPISSSFDKIKNQRSEFWCKSYVIIIFIIVILYNIVLLHGILENCC